MWMRSQLHSGDSSKRTTFTLVYYLHLPSKVSWAIYVLVLEGRKSAILVSFCFSETSFDFFFFLSKIDLRSIYLQHNPLAAQDDFWGLRCF